MSGASDVVQTRDWHPLVCSVVLARMLRPLGWQDAVRYLDLAETTALINDGFTPRSPNCPPHVARFPRCENGNSDFA